MIKKVLFGFFLILVLSLIPPKIYADISVNSVIISTKGAIINATNNINFTSINIKDGGVKITVTPSTEERNYTFYRTGSSAQFTTSLINLQDTKTNFTINNTPPTDTTLNVTGMQVTGFYLNNILTNPNRHFINGINVLTIAAKRNVALFYVAIASNVVDNDLTTKWTSNNEAHPNVYVDMGSPQIIAGVAIYPDKIGSTCTQVKFQTSLNAVAWTDKRTVNLSALTDSIWNFARWDIDNSTERYVRTYCTDAGNKILSIWELKLLTPSLLSTVLVHGHKVISSSDSSLPLNQ